MNDKDMECISNCVKNRERKAVTTYAESIARYLTTFKPEEKITVPMLFDLLETIFENQYNEELYIEEMKQAYQSKIDAQETFTILQSAVDKLRARKDVQYCEYAWVLPNGFFVVTKTTEDIYPKLHNMKFTSEEFREKFRNEVKGNNKATTPEEVMFDMLYNAIFPQNTSENNITNNQDNNKENIQDKATARVASTTEKNGKAPAMSTYHAGNNLKTFVEDSLSDFSTRYPDYIFRLELEVNGINVCVSTPMGKSYKYLIPISKLIYEYRTNDKTYAECLVDSVVEMLEEDLKNEKQRK